MTTHDYFKIYSNLIDTSWLPLIRGRLLKNGHRDLAKSRGTLRVNTYRVICLELSNLLRLQSLVPKLGVTGTGETDMQHLENVITMTSYERHGIWNRGQIVSLFNGLFRVTPKRPKRDPTKRPKPLNGGFLSQRASIVESVSMSWRFIECIWKVPLILETPMKHLIANSHKKLNFDVLLLSGVPVYLIFMLFRNLPVAIEKSELRSRKVYCHKGTTTKGRSHLILSLMMPSVAYNVAQMVLIMAFREHSIDNTYIWKTAHLLYPCSRARCAPGLVARGYPHSTLDARMEGREPPELLRRTSALGRIQWFVHRAEYNELSMSFEQNNYLFATPKWRLFWNVKLNQCWDKQWNLPIKTTSRVGLMWPVLHH